MEITSEVDAIKLPQRLHLSRGERPMEVDPALSSPEVALQSHSGDAEITGQQLDGPAAIGQLVRCYPDVIELLADRERDAVSVVEGAPAGGKRGALRPLPLGPFGPPVALNQLELRSPEEDGDDTQGKAKLNNRDAGLRPRHQGPLSPGMGKRTNSESAGSCSPNVRSATGTSTWRLEATRIRRSSSARRASRFARSPRRSWRRRAVWSAAV
jgi:hypothetical protein